MRDLTSLSQATRSAEEVLFAVQGGCAEASTDCRCRSSGTHLFQTEPTIDFYTEVLGMHLTLIVENRDEPTSTHIFFRHGQG